MIESTDAAVSALFPWVTVAIATTKNKAAKKPHIAKSRYSQALVLEHFSCISHRNIAVMHMRVKQNPAAETMVNVSPCQVYL